MVAKKLPTTTKISVTLRVLACAHASREVKYLCSQSSGDAAIWEKKQQAANTVRGSI